MASRSTFLSILYFLILFQLTKSKEAGNQNNSSSAFMFIKNLQEGCCQKGSKVQGLHDLKLYLSCFGYLNYQPARNQLNTDNEIFDDELESALKTYQKFYHLNITGTLDGPTISRMVMPRCGHPDIKTIHHRMPKSLHIVSHFKFLQNNPKWLVDKTNLTYAFAKNYSETYVPPVVGAFNTWVAALGYFTYARVDDFENADLKISFERGEHGDGAPFDGPYGVLAHASSPPNGRLHFDADENWSVGTEPVPDTNDLQSVALHEIGHLIGLAHSKDENAVMWSLMPSGSLK